MDRLEPLTLDLEPSVPEKPSQLDRAKDRLCQPDSPQGSPPGEEIGAGDLLRRRPAGEDAPDGLHHRRVVGGLHYMRRVVISNAGRTLNPRSDLTRPNDVGPQMEPDRRH
jgi:hypothetical protein